MRGERSVSGAEAALRRAEADYERTRAGASPASVELPRPPSPPRGPVLLGHNPTSCGSSRAPTRWKFGKRSSR